MLTAIPQYIEVRKNRDGQERAYLAGTRIRIMDLVVDHERLGQSVDDLLRGFPQLSPAQVYAALAYYHADRDAIWRCVREDEDFIDSMKHEMVSLEDKISASISSR